MAHQVDIEARRSRRMGEMHVSWERLVSIALSQRRRVAGVSRPPEETVLTMEELGGRLPGLGIGAREFGPVRIYVLGGLRCLVDERLHFTDSAVIRVCGSGVLDMDISADGDVVFVISGDCTVINRSARQTGIDYFVNNGALLCFPRIPEEESRELRRHVHLASFDGAFVQYGGGTSRDAINERYCREWETAFAVGDSEVLSLLKDTRLAGPDDCVQVVLRR